MRYQFLTHYSVNSKIFKFTRLQNWLMLKKNQQLCRVLRCIHWTNLSSWYKCSTVDNILHSTLANQSSVMLMKKQESIVSCYFLFLVLCCRTVQVPAPNCTLLRSTGLDRINKPNYRNRVQCWELLLTFEVFSGLL